METLRRRVFTPFSLSLERNDATAPAHGVAVLPADAAQRVDVLAQRAERYAHLQVSLLEDVVLFWSPDARDLPWFPDAIWHLGPPLQRIFVPLGWRLATPPLLMPACLAVLERDFNTRPPIALRPPVDDAPPRVIDLRDSGPASEVDWRAVGRAL